MTAKAKRRRFTAEYKHKILQEADGCMEAGHIGALLRREGLYSSHLVDGRRAREVGELEGPTPRRGRATSEPLGASLASRARGKRRRGAERRHRDGGTSPEDECEGPARRRAGCDADQ